MNKSSWVSQQKRKKVKKNTQSDWKTSIHIFNFTIEENRCPNPQLLTSVWKNVNLCKPVTSNKSYNRLQPHVTWKNSRGLTLTATQSNGKQNVMEKVLIYLSQLLRSLKKNLRHEMLFHNNIIKATWLSSTNRNVIFGPMWNSPVCIDLLVKKILMGTVVLHL